MCLAADWEGIDATGKLALVKRGICAVAEKAKLARARGALGVILYNQTPGQNYSMPTFGQSNRTLVIPTGIIPLDVGLAWKDRLAKGEELVVTLLVDSVMEVKDSWNVISETKSGDPNNVIMLGAHLDSVQAGPGINDDGSGTAALLELMGSFKKYELKNKIRFGWWGAEE
jgi:Zn-dependent M28 family amino/carboxypeptidase